MLPIMLLLPLAGALIVAAGRNKFSRNGLAGIATASVGVSFAAALAALLALRSLPEGEALRHRLIDWGSWGGEPFALGLLGDEVSIWWMLVVTGVGFLIHLYSAEYMADEADYGRYFAKLNYFVFAMSLLVLSDNFLGLLIGWANVGVASFLLIGFWNRRQAAAEAARKAFIVNAVGEVGLILAAVLIFAQFGGWTFERVFQGVETAPVGALTAIGLLLLIGAVAKSAQLPLHVWLPDAMQGPTPVSALIHAATMVTAGVYLVVRAYPIYEAAPLALHAVAVAGACSALFGAIVAVGQSDFKRVLAFSTMSQVGFMMLGAGVGAYEAAMFHFMTHAFFKALLFLLAGVIIHHLGGEQDIRRMGGVGKQMPAVYAMFLVGVLAIAGAPGLAGFFSKEEILHAVYMRGEVILWALGVAAASLTAFYMVRLFCLVFAGEPHGGHEGGAGGRGPGVVILIPLAVLTLLSISGGWLHIPGVTDVTGAYLGGFFDRFSRRVALIGQAPAWLGWLTIAAAGVAAWLSAMWFRPQGMGWKTARAAAGRADQGPLAAGFFVDSFYQALVVRPLIGLSKLIGLAVDPWVVDGIVKGLSGLAARAGSAVQAVHRGHMRRYALSVAAGAGLALLYVLVV